MLHYENKIEKGFGLPEVAKQVVAYWLQPYCVYGISARGCLRG